MHMRALFYFLIFILLTSTAIHAQESIGYTDSTNFQQLVDYRLPNWGYSQFSIRSGGLSLSGRNMTSEREDQGNNSIDESTNTNVSERFSINPSYNRYEESELQILRLSTSFGFTNRINHSESEIKEYDINRDDRSAKTNSNDNNFTYSLATNYSRYLNDSFFLYGSFNSSINYRFSSYESNSNENGLRTNDSERRSINFYPSVGIGFGRVRNVTNVLRAIRLKERYEVVSGQTLGGAEILNTADQFTRFQSYQQTYDRPEKYFWGDLNSILDNKLDRLSAFDLFYLSDVFDEQLGSRFEGAELLFSVDYRYNNSLLRAEEELDGSRDESRNISIERAATVKLDADFYKNLNLKNQIHIAFNNRGMFPLERANNYEWQFRSDLEFNWLYVIADRWHVNNYITSSFNTFSLKERERIVSIKSHNINTSISSNLTYFIENRMGITGNLSFGNDYQYDRQFLTTSTKDTWNRFDWNFQLGVIYYFNRNLF